jgi:polysaccharide biosynthesis transport protein
LTDKLLLHDLQASELNEQPFRTPEGKELGMTESELDNLVIKLKTSLNDSSLNKKPQLEIPGNKLTEAYGYDYETLLKKLEIKRVGETDYLTVEYKSESPELSYFVVNTFLTEFFALHETDLSTKEDQVLKFQTEQLRNRRMELDSIIEKINRYKNSNQLVDVSKQRESIIGHIKELELKLEEQRQRIPALQGQIKILNNEILKYNKELGDYLSSNIHFSEEYSNLDKRLKQAQEQYVENLAAGKSTDAILKRIEALRDEQSKYIGRSVSVVSGKAKENIDAQVREWIKESLEKQLDLELAESAFASYQKEIASQQAKANRILLNDNELAGLEAEKDRVEKEYQRVRAEYDEAEGSENPLTVIEPAMKPDEPESKHRTVFAAFAGVASGSLASIVLFLLAFIDTSLQSPSQFQRMTNLPLLGYVNRVKVKSMNLQDLFSHTQKKQELEVFKENIRKLRTVIETSGAQSFLFVSPEQQEGKSFLIVLLAYALSLNDKRVLIIDTNFKNNTISGFKTKSFIEITTNAASSGGLKGLGSNWKQLPPHPGNSGSDDNLKNIDIVGNKGGNQSPSEILAGKDFQKIIDKYKNQYDFIFLEAAAMNQFSDARELLPYTEKLIAVFSTQTSIDRACKETIDFLRSMNGKMLGGILNNVDLKNL